MIKDFKGITVTTVEMRTLLRLTMTEIELSKSINSLRESIAHEMNKPEPTNDFLNSMIALKLGLEKIVTDINLYQDILRRRNENA